MLWLVERNPELEIFLLRWDVGALKTLLRGSTFFTLLKWMAHPRIHTKLDGAHPTGSSHHQKIVVIDDALAFCGGIDMTADRWDTRAHAFEDERRRRPFTRRRYKPWHDASTALTGPAAARLGEICRQRWLTAGGAPDPQAIEGVPATWPDGLWTTFRDLDIAVSRSAPELGDRDAVREIEELYVDQIRAARRIVYAESQYFASRRIAEAIAHRLEEPDGPEIVVGQPGLGAGVAGADRHGHGPRAAGRGAPAARPSRPLPHVPSIRSTRAARRSMSTPRSSSSTTGSCASARPT